MASNNQTYSLPSQPVPLNPISIVDIFFPGLNNISAALQQLQASSPNSYGGMLCICGIVVFLGKYAYKSVKEFVDTYFSSWLSTSLVGLSDNQQLPLSTSPIPMKHTTCLSPGYPLSHLPTGHLPSSLA
jgi:chaperone BCS1